MKNWLRNFFMLLAGILFHANVFAQSLSASIDRNPVAVGDQFQVTFTLNATGSSFHGPVFSDFNVLANPSQSTSMNIINGSISQSLSISYYLQAKSEGTFKIGSASIICNGKKLESPPFTITVVKASSRPQQQPQQKQESTENNGVSPRDVFLMTSADKKNVYLGEGIVVTYKLYTKFDLLNYAILKDPALNGFWSQDIQLPAYLNQRTETVNSVQYVVYEVKKVVLFPQQSGTLVIDPMEREYIARIQVPIDIYNFRSFGIREVKIKVKSDPINITVNKLPPGPPSSFTGSVGKFNFEASLDKNKTKPNDPVTLKIKISGKGNLSLVDPPKINFPPDIETYDPKVINNISTTAAGSSGNKIFEYLLIPRHGGNYRIDPVQFSYFDLDKKNYVSLSSSSFNLDVESGTGDNTAAISGVGKADVQIIGKDIRFIKTGNIEFVNAAKEFYGSWVFYLLFALPFILFVLLIIMKKRKEARDGNIKLVKSSKANKMAKKRLAIAKKLLNEKNYEKFYDESFKALWGYTGDKLGILPSDLSKDAAANSLKQKNVSDDSINKLISTLDYCEFARFASANSGVSPENIYNDSVTIITKLEEEIK
ncbi:MAG TPA: BatD family protein [Bacteroidia bacterium]|nr:BatD family protein [Bacteroidia bacterium]